MVIEKKPIKTTAHPTVTQWGPEVYQPINVSAPVAAIKLIRPIAVADGIRDKTGPLVLYAVSKLAEIIRDQKKRQRKAKPKARKRP